MPLKCKTPHFSIPQITGYYDPGLLWVAGRQDTDLSCIMCRFSSFVALFDHSPPTF